MARQSAGRKGEPSSPARVKFTKAELDRLLRTEVEGQRTIWDEKQTGLSVLVSKTRGRDRATITFRVCFYLSSKPGKPIYQALGRYPDQLSDIEEVRRLASEIRNNAKKGIDPRRPTTPGGFEALVRSFIELHAKKKNRTWPETQRVLDTYVLPEWGDRSVGSIRRSDVAALLDKIEHKRIKHKTIKGKFLGGAVTADATLAALSKLFNWHATRTDDFISPIVKGMRRAGTPKSRARKRVLSDHELRLMWPILDQLGAYGAALKCMILTMQRARKKVARMRRSEIINGVPDPEGRQLFDDVWDPVGADDPANKGVSVVPLSAMAREIIDAVPITDADTDADWVFSVNGRAPIRGWSKYKARLDAKMLAAYRKQAEAEGMDPRKIKIEPWQLRDLRRTARTLMSRCRIPHDISERCLGHVMQGVRGTYDRYEYLAPKRQAFDRLAAEVALILNPQDNVVALRG
jgi:hypothetical protein